MPRSAAMCSTRTPSGPSSLKRRPAASRMASFAASGVRLTRLAVLPTMKGSRMTDPSSIVEAGHGRAQGADFNLLPSLTHRPGIWSDDASPPRHLTLPGAGGIRLHALDWGGDRQPTLFLHGGQLKGPTWDYVCLRLRGRVRAPYEVTATATEPATTRSSPMWPTLARCSMRWAGSRRTWSACRSAASSPRILQPRLRTGSQVW